MKKRSLHIGINNYPGTNSDLNGCVNDAMTWKEELHKRGFEWQDLLLDYQATRKGMMDAIADIVVASKAGDLTVITYSGHGTYVRDENSDEPDKRDEALCPWDMDKTGEVITDDYLYDVFKAADKDARIIFISDSCHSGSVTKDVKPMEGPFDGAPWKYQKARFLPPSVKLTDAGFTSAAKTGNPPQSRVKKEDLVLLLAGCKDTEYSYDAWFNGKPNGALTYTALWTLQKLKEGATYEEWFAAIRKFLPHAEYPQTPQMCGTDVMKKWKVFE